jgi:hypothetical protein
MRLIYKSLASGTSANANFTTNAVAVGEFSTYSVTCNVTSTATGTVALQASNDWAADETGPASPKWVEISGANSAIVTGSDVMFNVQNSGYTWMRVIYTSTSGTGTATIDFNGKAPTERGRPYYSGG